MFSGSAEVWKWSRGSCAASFCPAEDDVVIQIAGLLLLLLISALRCEAVFVSGNQLYEPTVDFIRRSASSSQKGKLQHDLVVIVTKVARNVNAFIKIPASWLVFTKIYSFLCSILILLRLLWCWNKCRFRLPVVMSYIWCFNGINEVVFCNLLVNMHPELKCI